MNKYKVIVADIYTVYRTVEIEATDEIAAKEEALAQTFDDPTDITQFEYSDTNVWIADTNEKD